MLLITYIKGRDGRVWGAVVVCGARMLCVGRGGRVWARWSCVGRGGRVWDVDVVCGARWSCVGAVVVCGARWSCVGRGGRVWDAVVVCGRDGRVWDAVVVCWRGGRVWGAVVVCGARWSCGRASGCRLKGPGFETTSAVSKLGQLRSPQFAVSFGRVSKSRWSILPGVYARGSKRSHTGNWKTPVTDSLTLEKEYSKWVNGYLD